MHKIRRRVAIKKKKEGERKKKKLGACRVRLFGACERCGKAGVVWARNSKGHFFLWVKDFVRLKVSSRQAATADKQVRRKMRESEGAGSQSGFSFLPTCFVQRQLTHNAGQEIQSNSLVPACRLNKLILPLADERNEYQQRAAPMDLLASWPSH